MNKISNKKISAIFYSLAILAILALGVIIMPLKTSADMGGYVTGYNTTRFNSVQSNERYNYYVGQNDPTVVYYPTTPVVYVNNPPVYQTTITDTSTAEQSTADTTPNKSTEDGESLVASVIWGSNSFMPSGLVQWIFFAILILIIVILTRKIFRGEDKYHSTPMKHA